MSSSTRASWDTSPASSQQEQHNWKAYWNSNGLPQIIITGDNSPPATMGSSHSTLGRKFPSKVRPSTAPSSTSVAPSEAKTEKKPAVIRRISKALHKRKSHRSLRTSILKRSNISELDPRRDSALTESSPQTDGLIPNLAETTQPVETVATTSTVATSSAVATSSTVAIPSTEATSSTEAAVTEIVAAEPPSHLLATTLDQSQIAMSDGIRARYQEPCIAIPEDSSVEPCNVDRYGFVIEVPLNLRTSGELPPIQEEMLHPALRPRNRLQKQSRRSLRPAGSIISKAHSHSASIRSVRSQAYLHLPNKHNERTIHKAGSMLFTPPALDTQPKSSQNSTSEAHLKKRERLRDGKWQNMAVLSQELNGRGVDVFFDPTNPKVVERTWKGIPDRWRADAWFSFLRDSAQKDPKAPTIAFLVETFYHFVEQPCADDSQIDVDVPRTINDHVLFRERYSSGQRLLFRVLHAITLYLPETGYVQGMAAIVATLLCYYTEERAFIVLVWLFRYRSLAYLYSPGFTGLMSCLQTFDEVYLARKPQIAQKLEELGITTMTFGTKWYLTLFNYSLPFSAQLRVWDVLMVAGTEHMKVLHATSAALIDASREVLENADFENAMKTLTSFVPVKDEDILMKTVWAEWRLQSKKA